MVNNHLCCRCNTQTSLPGLHIFRGKKIINDYITHCKKKMHGNAKEDTNELLSTQEINSKWHISI